MDIVKIKDRLTEIAETERRVLKPSIKYEDNGQDISKLRGLISRYVMRLAAKSDMTVYEMMQTLAHLAATKNSNEQCAKINHNLYPDMSITKFQDINNGD